MQQKSETEHHFKEIESSEDACFEVCFYDFLKLFTLI